LTKNGKVDKKALTEFHSTSGVREIKMVLPVNEIEVKIHNVWKNILGLEEISMNDNLFELGGDSITATKLTSQVAEFTGINIPLHELFNKPTAAGMSIFVNNTLNPPVKSTNSLKDHKNSNQDKLVNEPELGFDYDEIVKTMEIDSTLNIDINIEKLGQTACNPDKPKAVLLTGATGFLGSYVLRELLVKTNAEIYCLVRVKKGVSAKNRILNSLKKYNLWEREYSERIVAIPAELGAKYFSLSTKIYGMLCTEIDVIYHVASDVNLVRAYDDLKKTNIEGVRSLITLSYTNSLKPINYISTKFLCLGLKKQGVKISRAEGPVDDPDGLFVGYTQTKWVAEKLLASAIDYGIPVNIFRPGQLTAATGSTDGLLDDVFSQLSKLLMSVDSIPEKDDWIDGVVDITPVDYLANAIVYVGSNKNSYGKFYNIGNPSPLPVADYVRKLLCSKEDMYEKQIVTFEKWALDCLEAIDAIDDEHTSYLLKRFFVETEHGRFIRNYLLDYKLENSNATQMLSNNSMKCPSVSEYVDSTYIACIQKFQKETVT